MEDRYARQILIHQIGIEGQVKISKASVFIIGAGGLGSPALTYLVAAGIGRIGFIDSDIVASSNLNHQFLHNGGDIGRLKADSAKEKLISLNNEIEINAFSEHLIDLNEKNIFEGYNIVLGEETCFFLVNGKGIMMTGGLDTKLCPGDKIEVLPFADAG